MYNTVIWYLYILQIGASLVAQIENYHHSKSSYHPSSHIVMISFLWWELLRSTLCNFQVCDTLSLTRVTTLCVISPWLTYNCKLYLLTHFTHVGCPPKPRIWKLPICFLIYVPFLVVVVWFHILSVILQHMITNMKQIQFLLEKLYQFLNQKSNAMTKFCGF